MNPVKEKISCIIWEPSTSEWKGADLSMLEISNYITSNAEKTSIPIGYFYVGVLFSILVASKFSHNLFFYIPRFTAEFHS
jgi:hypothetical protein